MTKRRKVQHPHDPRKVTGAEGAPIAGPGGPHDRASVIVDTRRAVLLEDVVVSTVDRPGDGTPYAVALQLSGRINRTPERVNVLFLMGSDGVAAIVSELVALVGRASGAPAVDILTDLIARVETLRKEGNLS